MISSLRAFLDSSPTPFHAVGQSAQLLLAAGFVEITGFEHIPARGFVQRDGSLIAWNVGTGEALRVIAAHTDSPVLKLTPHPAFRYAELSMLQLEPYGSPLLNSWLDRDLGLAGRVTFEDGTSMLINSTSPIARVPQLAVHLDRAINTDGLQLNPHQHLNAIWCIEDSDFSEWIGNMTGRAPETIGSFDLMCVDAALSAVIGDTFLASGRLDNLVSCWGAIQALCSTEAECAAVILYDHEEVGSNAAGGAASHWPTAVCKKVFGQLRDPELFLADSLILSADMAHGVHPNYPERSDPQHPVILGRGIALKSNVNHRYATTDRSGAALISAARIAGTDIQLYHHRADLPCGSTIGPTMAAAFGASVVDAGVPQLSMHSCRELISVHDLAPWLALCTAWLRT